jgi:hypothetical protein
MARLATLLILLAAAASAQPRVISLDPALLAQAKVRAAAGDPALAPALARLRRDADKAAALKPLSVMDKTRTAPSGDKHDYLSLAPYSWPDPAKPDGLPWINRDGQVNPASREGTDHQALDRLCGTVNTLALAWYFTGQPDDAERAVALLKVWFLDDATRMNPNLTYAQGVPGRSDGSHWGIIDTVTMIALADDLGLLDGAPAFTPAVRDGLSQWFGALAKWLTESKNGLDELSAPNNHGTWCHAQAAAYALAAGDRATARRMVEDSRRLIASQIQPDGRQPLELARTKSYSYTLYNLRAWFTLAQIGRGLDVDLFAVKTDDGRCLRVALDYLAPYFADPQTWPGKQIEPVKAPDDGLATLLRQAARVYHEPRYEALLQPHRPALQASRLQLLWPAG